MKEQAPETLYRFTKKGKYKFDRRGYLLPHHKPPTIKGKLLYPDTVPMVSEEDWNFIAHYFGSNDWEFLKLNIKRDQIEKLSYREHSYLRDYEYFGKVHRIAVLKAEICEWHDNKIVIKEVYNP